MVREIPLTRGKIALVDDCDWDWLSQYRWFACNTGRKIYAMRKSPRTDGRQSTVYMHREILRTPDGFETDHINMNPLDNRRANLRISTSAQNQANSERRKILGFKGVTKRGKKWRAQMRLSGKRVWLGSFSTAEAAAKACDDAARNHHGIFARLNFPKDS